jgi:hypothetical protein
MKKYSVKKIKTSEGTFEVVFDEAHYYVVDHTTNSVFGGCHATAEEAEMELLDEIIKEWEIDPEEITIEITGYHI